MNFHRNKKSKYSRLQRTAPHFRPYVNPPVGHKKGKPIINSMDDTTHSAFNSLASYHSWTQMQKRVPDISDTEMAETIKKLDWFEFTRFNGQLTVSSSVLKGETDSQLIHLLSNHSSFPQDSPTDPKTPSPVQSKSDIPKPASLPRQPFLARIAFCIPKDHRKAIIGDIIEDSYELKENGTWRLTVYARTAGQFVLAILTLWPSALVNAIRQRISSK